MMFQAADSRGLRTFVVRLDPPAVAEELLPSVLDGIARGATAFGAVKLFEGDRRFAVVLHQVDDAVYFVHTTAAPKTLGNHATSLRSALRAAPLLGAAATIRWIRPLNRHLQRAFGWGDVAATKADVEAAAAAAQEDGNTAPLRELLPWLGSWSLPPWDEARTSCEEIVGMLPSLPRIFAALQGPPMPQLKDCDHDWVEDARGSACGGACRDAYLFKSFYRCRVCQATKCRGCLEDLEKAAACEKLVEQFRQRAEPGENAFGCFAHRPHPLEPDAFFVLDAAKMADGEKLEWIAREFGTTAEEAAVDDLPAFAELCLGLVGEHVRGEVPQKALVFKLFTRFVGERLKIGKEADVPPPIREKLAPLWGRLALLCHECGGDLGPEPVQESCYGEERHWCSRACEHAAKGYELRCPACGSRENAPGSVQTALWPCLPRVFADLTATCAGCGKEHTHLITVRRPGSPSPERSAGGGPAAVSGSPREPAWKRRRRA